MTEKEPKVSWEFLRHPFRPKYGPTVYIAFGDTVTFTVIRTKQTKSSTGLVHTEEVISQDIPGVIKDYTLSQRGGVRSITVTFPPSVIDWAMFFFAMGRDLRSKTFSASEIGYLSIDTPNPRIPITDVAQPG